MMGLDGKTALVTGGSRGIGEAVVSDLARRGASVVFTYLERRAAAEAVAERLNSEGLQALAVPSDVRDPSTPKAVIEACREAYGLPDLLVNNAGVLRPAALAFMSDDAWRDVMATNLDGVFFLTRYWVQNLLKEGRTGSIVNVSSVAGTVGSMANYSASKAGLIGFTQALGKELAPRGIRVNAVTPGYIQTEMTVGLDSSSTIERVPVGRFGTAEAVAAAVSFLLSDEASYITGTVVRVDGGLGA